MKDLDPKSLIIGFLAASVVSLAVALIQPKEETKVSEGVNRMGRYVPAFEGGGTLDTVTGQLYLIDGRSWEIKEEGYTPILIKVDFKPIKGEIKLIEEEKMEGEFELIEEETPKVDFSKPLETRPPKTDLPPKK
jgi:hypothetical protein